MKKSLVVLLAACILLLAACAGLAVSDPVPLAELPEAVPAETAYEEPEYGVTPFTSGDQIKSEDGEEQVLALYNYQIVLLELRNGEEVSPEDAEAAERTVEAFNGKMRSVLAELVEQGKAMGEDAREAYKEFGAPAEEYEDGAAVSAEFCGCVVSLCLERGSYTGGAHPNRYTVGYLFDLRSCQFIDPTQIAEDPETFRTGAAAVLLEQAEDHPERASFWEDYAEVIARWNEGTVLFDGEGMQVVYSPYELGPYAIGEVVFRLDWEELSPLIGESGMELLGEQQAFK